MNQKTLLKKLKHGHDYFDKIIDQIIEMSLSDQIIKSKWTIKDVLLHLTWYNNEVITALRKKSLGGNFWSMSIENRNDMIFKNSEKTELKTVRLKYSQSYQNLIFEVKKLSDKELNSENFMDFKLLENSGGPQNTFEFILGNSSPHHYEEHLDDLIEKLDLNY